MVTAGSDDRPAQTARLPFEPATTSTANHTGLAFAGHPRPAHIR